MGKISFSVTLTILTVSLCIILVVISVKKITFDGNNEKFSVSNTAEDPESPLKDKTIIFLGSSVTYGSGAKGESFVDFSAKKDGIFSIKEAVPGTTLVDNGENSYISRMKKIDKSIKADAFICQLSTNDATLKLPVGTISESKNIDDFDTSTIAGSIEYIISYANSTWKCPVIFYTGTKYDSLEYETMVKLLKDIQEKWNIGIIDLWNNDMNNISKLKYKLYMKDPIHPTRAGYREWWLPEFEKYLTENLK